MIDPQTRQGIARIALSYDAALRPGGFASATIVAGGSTAPELPQSALLSDEKGNYVYIVDASNHAQRRNVTLGEVAADRVVISGGLSGNERVVQSAGAFLTPDTLARAHELGLDAAEFLTRNDSGTFFARLGDALGTGPSGHNLNDFRALAVGWSVWGAAGVTPTVTN